MRTLLLRGITWAILLSVYTFTIPSRAQQNDKLDDELFRAYYDSIQQNPYPYTFPIWGQKVYERGYDFPYPWGLSLVYFTQRQEIRISKTFLGINGGQMVDFSKYISFGPTIATTNAYTFRPDLWILPFLNLYAIVGTGTTETEVRLQQPIVFETQQRFVANSFGLGMTLSGAIGPVWIAWDNNYNWVDVDVVVEPVPAFNSSLRIGHTLPSHYHPQRSLSVWAGVFYQSIQNDTQGSIALTSVFPNAGSGKTIENLRDWATGLPPAQRIVANQIIDRLERLAQGDFIDNTEIDYKLNKEVVAPFNLIFGAQYQFNKHWMLRSELGVFGKRSQFLLNLNYRFLGI